MFSRYNIGIMRQSLLDQSSCISYHISSKKLQGCQLNYFLTFRRSI